MPSLFNQRGRSVSRFLTIFGLVSTFVSLIYILFPDNRDNEYIVGTQTAQLVQSSDIDGSKKPKRVNAHKYEDHARSCPEYASYAAVPHFKLDDDLSTALPFQRPPKNCRTFRSKLVDAFIEQMKLKLKDENLARLFENTFPNTLDTTILYHVTEEQNKKLQNHGTMDFKFRNEYAETFIVTGDIHAEWLRDSAWQLSVYQPFIKYDESLRELIKGAINTQSQLILSNAYCNAFHPPQYTRITRAQGHIDEVFPRPNWRQVFECKYEIDSLASFFTLSRQYYENSPRDKRLDFVTNDWLFAVTQVLTVLGRESVSTFDKSGNINKFYYTFKRNTNVASETLPLAGTGNPVNMNTGLVRSAFRPSDDSTIFQFFIPGNAHMAVELEGILPILKEYSKVANDQEIAAILPKIIKECERFAASIRKGIQEHAIVDHPTFGKVYAYEVDGYGGRLLMDDANIPSLLSLPDLGYVSAEDPVYQNTRRMILSPEGNPYFIKGKYFQGIGGPHVGLHNPWPLSLIVKIRSSKDELEIMETLRQLMETSSELGLIHETVNGFIPLGKVYTRSWFAWANSEFAKTILHIAETRPWLILKNYKQGDKFNLQDFIRSLSSSTL